MPTVLSYAEKTTILTDKRQKKPPISWQPSQLFINVKIKKVRI